MENASEQQYIEVGSNMFLGTKDGMKYTLIQTPDNKFRLVETLSDVSENADISSGSPVSSVKKEGQNEEIDEWMKNRSGSKLIKLVAEPSPCRGQGDEVGNSVLSDPANLEAESVDRGSELTYTTLLPRHEKSEVPDTSLCYSSPASDYYEFPPSFSTPMTIRPPRYVRKPTRLLPCSPVPRIRGAAPRQRRPRKTAYQYNPQMLHSTPGTVSSTCNDSQVSFGATLSGHSYGENQISVEYPRAPNNTPNSSEAAVGGGNQDVFSLQWVPHVTSRADNNYISLDPRETHNEKERKRRLRIKNACQSMRSLLPSVTEKTDNATVFEQAVYFIAFVRDALGSGHDLEFLEQMYVP